MLIIILACISGCDKQSTSQKEYIIVEAGWNEAGSVYTSMYNAKFYRDEYYALLNYNYGMMDCDWIATEDSIEDSMGDGSAWFLGKLDVSDLYDEPPVKKSITEILKRHSKE